MPVPLEFTSTYDRKTLDASASKLFNHLWSPLFPHLAIALLTVGVLGSVISFAASGNSETTRIFFFCTLAFAASWVGLFLRLRSRLRRRIGTRGKFAIAKDSLLVDFDDRPAQYAWTDFQSIEVDATIVFLFLHRGGAIVIPRSDIPAEGMQFIEARSSTT
jgi:hypothetical protein